MAKVNSYLEKKPDKVAGNLRRLLDAAGWKSLDLSRVAKISVTTIDRMMGVFEPPTNHPYLGPISEALAKKLGRKRADVLAELQEGGAGYDFNGQQLARIYQSRRDLAPEGFFAAKPVARKPKVQRNGVAHARANGDATNGKKYKSLMQLFDNDPRVKTIAKQLGVPLPSAKVGVDGSKLKQTAKAKSMRAYKLGRRLRETGVDVKALMRGENDAPKPRARVARGRPVENSRSIAFRAVVTFNQRRMEGEKMFIMPMDHAELMLGDWLKQSDINENVLIGADIHKLAPRT